MSTPIYLPLLILAQASGSRCRNTSPNSPPTAKLSSNFSLLAAAASIKSKPKIKEIHLFRQLEESYASDMPVIQVFFLTFQISGKPQLIHGNTLFTIQLIWETCILGLLDRFFSTGCIIGFNIQWIRFMIYACMTTEWTCDPDISQLQTFDLCNHIEKWPRLITYTYICIKWLKFFPNSIKPQSISHTHYKSCSSVVFNILHSSFLFEEIKLAYVMSVIKVIHIYRHVQVQYI